MKIVPLDWDSTFFGRRTGSISIDNALDEKQLAKLIEESSEFEILYLFSPEEILLNLPENDPKCTLVDRKITFHQKIQGSEQAEHNSLPFHVEEFTSKEMEPELESLAYQSGAFSRFKLDLNFKPSDFYRLYQKWIENSVSRDIADYIYVVRTDGKIVAFITVKLNVPSATIGLVAVDESTRGMNVGSTLMKHLIGRVGAMDITDLFVNTQLHNENSCRFYLKNGFAKHKITNIYHYWR